MPTGAVPDRVLLSGDDRLTLTYLADHLDEGHLLKVRAAIVIACAQSGATLSGIARALGISRQTVALWRSRFLERGIEGLVSAEDIAGGYETHRWKSGEYCDRYAMLISAHDEAPRRHGR